MATTATKTTATTDAPRARPPRRRHDPPVQPAHRPLSGIGRATGQGSLPPPELALMRAVLEDAVLCYLGRAKRRRIDPRILAREAEHWIRIDDWESPFSFNNVCEALGLNHESTRRTILTWRESDGGAGVTRLAGLL